MRRTVFGGLFLLVVLMATGCGRDFALPTSDFAIQAVTVNPLIARQGVTVELEVHTVGSAPTAVSARMLGGSFVDAGLQADGTWLLTHEAAGTEPEGSEVRIDVEAEGEGETVVAIAWTKFDFTPPTLDRVEATDLLLEADGESAEVKFIFDEALVEAPTITVAGRPLDCVQETRVGWSCLVTAAPGDPAGWLSAQVAAADLAGNTLSTTAQLGVAIDRIAAPAPLALSLVSQLPLPATAGQAVSLLISADLPLSDGPTASVTLRDGTSRALNCQALELATGQYRCDYMPLPFDLGGSGDEGPVDLSVEAVSLQGQVGHLDAAVELDLLGPQIVNLTATRNRLLADETVTLLVAFHEPVVSAFFSIQGRVVSCTFTGPETASCTYRATGNELEGPQRLEVHAYDGLGNASLLLVDTGVEFDFACQQLASRAFIVESTVRPTAFFAEPGVFEADSSVALALTEGGGPFVTLTARADGGVTETPVSSQVDRFVWFRATDPDGHVCEWERSSQRYRSEFAPAAGAASTNQAIPMNPGIRSMSLAAYTSDRGMGTKPPPLSLVELASLASVDGSTVTVPAPILAPMAWTNLGALPGAPTSNFQGPLVWDPNHRKVVRFAASTNSAEFLHWDGSTWTLGNYFYPWTIHHLWGWGLASSLSENLTFLYGGIDAGPPIDDFITYDGRGYLEIRPDVRPDGRYFPGLTYQERGHQLVLFGGLSSDLNGNTVVEKTDTWVWRGGGWTSLNTSSNPPARYGHSLVDDPLRGPLYLFGGVDGAAPYDDTWVFDGADWRIATPTTRPPGREHAGSTFHGGLESMLVFGGWGGAGQELGDLWAFDGANWSEITVPGGPPPLARAGVAYDYVRGALVVYGGVLSSGQYNRDLWELSANATYPQLVVQLQLPPFIESTSVATLAITARGVATRAGTDEEGLEVELWDETAHRWWPLSLSVEAGSTGGLANYSVQLNENILGRQSTPWVHLLLRSRAPATEDGGATLEIDSISMQIDTF